MTKNKRPGRVTTTYSLSDKGHDLLAKIAEHLGLSRTAWIEMAVREEARKLGLE
jgi:DNA-binding PadR family transcriptional regulator